ncbi:MAG: cytochrome c [Gammaproteobacteria bacterium]|jgi:cytochrome c553
MGRAAILTAALIALCAPALAQAGGDTELGRAKSTTCTACHGPDGRGTAPNYPVLAGQYEEYLAYALTQYRSGERKNAIMAGFAANLSDDDIADLAAWYASMEGLKTARR